MILRKIIKIVATRCRILSLKCTKFDFGWGSAPDPAGELIALTHTLAGFKGGLLLKGRGGEGMGGEGMEGERMEREEEGRGGREGERKGEGDRNKNSPSDRSGYGPVIKNNKKINVQ